VSSGFAALSTYCLPVAQSIRKVSSFSVSKRWAAPSMPKYFHAITRASAGVMQANVVAKPPCSHKGPAVVSTAMSPPVASIAVSHHGVGFVGWAGCCLGRATAPSALARQLCRVLHLVAYMHFLTTEFELRRFDGPHDGQVDLLLHVHVAVVVCAQYVIDDFVFQATFGELQ